MEATAWKSARLGISTKFPDVRKLPGVELQKVAAAFGLLFLAVALDKFTSPAQRGLCLLARRHAQHQALRTRGRIRVRGSWC